MVRNMLLKKLFREFAGQFRQFLAIVFLCALGSLAFAALDGTARLTRTTMERYFSENRLADYWITLPEADRTSLGKLRALPGVRSVRARAAAEMEVPALGEDVRLSVTLWDGPMDINTPYLMEGEAPDSSDRRGCLLDIRFAEAHALSVGDRITLRLSGMDTTLIIRGLVMEPEYVVVSQSVSSNPETYGFLLAEAAAFPSISLTQIVALRESGSDPDVLRREIEALLPSALVVDRRAHASTARIVNNAEMFENMTLIFPLLAYFIATLIVMTTLSRMIDAQRLQIGTLRALGYSGPRILIHYLSYALFPSAVGAVLGLFIGHNTLPFILWDVLMGQNEMPYRLQPRISPAAWATVGITVGLSLLVCFRAYRGTARENTASLLRPKPPKAGQRILLERIGPLWRRLGFNAKTVARNLMRNKLRSFMFFLGVLFCNMLLITSLGLQDSVTKLTEDYYYRVMRRDAVACVSGSGDASGYERRLDAEKVECVMTRPVSLRAPSGVRTVTLTVLSDTQTMQHLGEDASLVPLPAEGCAVTRKLTKTLSLSEGDEIRLFFAGDPTPVDLPIRLIVDNTFSQGVYLTRSVWESLHKGAYVPTEIQLLAPTEACLSALSRKDEVDRIDRPQEQIVETLDMLSMLSSVFHLLEGIALALAFVICYNMGLMNFTERTREYATLKVLGYHQREIRRLILSENLILTFAGTILGIRPGILLTDVVMHACEPESASYAGTPAFRSILLSCLVTCAFSVLIQLLLTRKVRSIDMVEALKSVE